MPNLVEDAKEEAPGRTIHHLSDACFLLFVNSPLIQYEATTNFYNQAEDTPL